jgi:hypothetical protein
MINNMNEDRLLVEEKVDEGYFLNVISSYEVKYGMSWGDFLGQWLSEDNQEKMYEGDSRKYADFSEWAFLCTSLLPALLTKDAECPPLEAECPCPPLRSSDDANHEKPDKISGFWFFGGRLGRPAAL